LQPFGGRGSGNGEGASACNGNTAKARSNAGQGFGDQQAPLVHVADVARIRLDFGKVVRREQDGGFGGAVAKALDEIVANQRVESAERLVENDEARMKCESTGERRFHSLAAREVLEAPFEREIEAFDELLLEGAVPLGIKRAAIGEEAADGHPVGQFLIFGDVAD
jgi:hypothetical protein